LPTFDAARAGDRFPRSTPARSRAAASNRRSAAPVTLRTEPVAAVEGTSPPPPAGDQNDATRDLALYRTAHRLHFQDRDPGRALAAWEAYLAAFPNGKLAVEAAWNRALCLVKLGRAEEAERLLERFAAGTFGGYRRTQAADLLASLRKHHVDR
jgi:TolA-binding protein